MAEQQAYQAYGHTNKGTLVPGQSIAINKYTVQVERYLSQGGFAHVYLVRTAAPVYGTTHHVLKRIAVANEAMLTEVKKEVDIMRILKGHPNIVHLIDAAWHRMPNGMYEVFILMEFCQGGGIIDMMNRRLRERLTESEILQIFVDVCEGVAAMHNLRPSVLHRDLKVENILQSTSTSFKLCDFGSATTVALKPPSSSQEIRALEADLNRHTTLQYRAPEMVDVHLRRPVDEKSDVWALGVLLYKLCYYTTPFEEHGPLAILNVQYRIPPYPVYSSQMNSLIGSMLREHGAQRPSVFELLSLVHRLRGTKSRFTYTIPSPQPLSPRHNLLPSSTSPPAANPLEDLVQFRSTVTSSTNAGIQAREKVLEAIAPMRRGRPAAESTAQKEKENETRRGKPWLDDGFSQEEKAWNAATHGAGLGVRGHKSGVVSSNAETWKAKSPAIGGLDDAWNVRGLENTKGKEKEAKANTGFGDDFADKLWNSTIAGQEPETKPDKVGLVIRPPATSPGELSSGMKVTPAVHGGSSKDAFHGLGLSSSNQIPEPTLAEARKYRTGLATVNGFDQMASSLTPSPRNLSTSRPSSASTRPTPSPRPAPQLTSESSLVSNTSRPSTSTLTRPTRSPSVQQSASRPGSSQQRSEGLPPETRFPSLEELDATFGSSSLNLRTVVPHSASQPQLHLPSSEKPSASPSLPHRSSNFTGGLRPVAQTALGHDGVRSEQVTGVAMRDSRSGEHKPIPEPAPSTSTTSVDTERDSKETITRPVLSRKHRSSVSIKPSSQSNLDVGTPSIPIALIPSRQEPTDWLTGIDDECPTSTASILSHGNKLVIRDSPGSGAAAIVNKVAPTKTQGAAPSQYSSPPSPSKVKATTTRVSRTLPSVSTDTLAAPRETGKENWSSVAVKSGHNELSSSDEHEGPEDAGRYNPSKEIGKEKDTRRAKRKGRQSSVHDLVDLWGGGITSGGLTTKEKDKPKEPSQAPAPVGLHESDTHTILPRRKTTMQASPGKLPSGLPRSSLPQDVPVSDPSTNQSPKRQTTVLHKTSSTEGNSLASDSQPRPSGRPQSMFIFPVSKSKSDNASSLEPVVVSPALSRPAEVPRRTRRTSISDMVQHYEAIGKSPTVASKPVTSKVNPQASTSAENGRLPKTHAPASVSLKANTRIEDTSGPSGQGRRQSSIVLPRPSLGTNRENELSIARGSQTSSPPKSTSLSTDGSSLEIHTHRTPASSEEQSPSPDLPYQGVGKLIDQWQRKTADTGPANVPLRRGQPVQRTGLARGGAGRGR